MKDLIHKIENEFSGKKIIKNKIELFIETDKLYNLKRNLEKFIFRWNPKRLNELRLPSYFQKRRKYFLILQWINRFFLATGGVLSLNGYQKTGGIISIFFPLIDLLLNLTLREKSENQKTQWDEFIKDVDNTGNALDELNSLVNSIEKFLSKKISYTKEIKVKIYDFWREYDENKNQVIEVHELKIEDFARDLKKKWLSGKEKILKDIINGIQNLQYEILNYQHFK